MKLTKYLSAVILFAAAIVLLILCNATSVPFSLPQTSVLYFREPLTVDFAALSASAEQHHVVIGALSERVMTAQSNACTLYTDTPELLQEALGFGACTIRDPLGNVHIMKFDSVQAAMADTETHCNLRRCYLFGDAEACKLVLREIPDTVSVQYEAARIGSEHLLPIMAFAVIYLLLLFCCAVDAAYSKRQAAIMILHGDHILHAYLKLCLTDTICFSGIFLLCRLLQQQFTPLLHFYEKAYLLYLPFLLGVWLVNLRMLHISPKEMLYGHQMSKRFMKLFTGIEYGISILSCGVMLFVWQTIPSIAAFRNAAPFFQQHEAYSFLSLQQDAEWVNAAAQDEAVIEEISAKERQFYQKAESILQPICICDLEHVMQDYGLDAQHWHPVSCNANALPIITEQYAEAAAVNLTDYDAALLLPAGLDDTEVETAKAVLCGQNHVQIIRFSADEPLLCFGDYGEKQFTFAEQPAIFIASERINVPYSQQINGCIFRTSQADALDMSQYPFRLCFTNIYEQFQNTYHAELAMLNAGIGVTFFLLILYGALLHTVIDLDYKINAVELAIRKVLGDSLLQRNSKHFIVISCMGGINLVLAIAFAVIVNPPQIIRFLLIPLLLFLTAAILIITEILKTERHRLTNILKGGAL